MISAFLSLYIYSGELLLDPPLWGEWRTYSVVLGVSEYVGDGNQSERDDEDPADVGEYNGGKSIVMLALEDL